MVERLRNLFQEPFDRATKRLLAEGDLSVETSVRVLDRVAEAIVVAHHGRAKSFRRRRGGQWTPRGQVATAYRLLAFELQDSDRCVRLLAALCRDLGFDSGLSQIGLWDAVRNEINSAEQRRGTQQMRKFGRKVLVLETPRRIRNRPIQ